MTGRGSRGRYAGSLSRLVQLLHPERARPPNRSVYRRFAPSFVRARPDLDGQRSEHGTTPRGPDHRQHGDIDTDEDDVADQTVSRARPPRSSRRRASTPGIDHFRSCTPHCRRPGEVVRGDPYGDGERILGPAPIGAIPSVTFSANPSKSAASTGTPSATPVDNRFHPDVDTGSDEGAHRREREPCGLERRLERQPGHSETGRPEAPASSRTGPDRTPEEVLSGEDVPITERRLRVHPLTVRRTDSTTLYLYQQDPVAGVRSVSSEYRYVYLDR